MGHALKQTSGFYSAAKFSNFALAVLAVAFSFCFFTPSANAESLTLKRPLNSNVNSRFGWRLAKDTGGNVSYDRLHAGTDYRARTPTPVPYEGTYKGCKNGIATIENACDIKQRFIHLSSCAPGALVSGSTGTKAPHLHHELYIAGTPVDGEHYFSGACGTDLCKGDVRSCLLDHAKTKGGNGGSAGARQDSTTPGPTADPNDPATTSTSTYVPSGGADPVTGTVNTGEPYYVDVYDGRVTRSPVYTNEENIEPVLDPTTEDVVSTGTSDNEITGCATDTWTAMVNQAVLQTRREVMINNRYILKADSVMAYSCFEGSVKKVGEELGPIFSESKRWVNTQVDIKSGPNVGSLGPGVIQKVVTMNKELGETSLDGAVQNGANFVFMAHARANFKHGLMGGLYETTAGSVEEDEDAGQDNLPCGTMAQVWQMAKCLNVSDEPLFPRFDQLIDPESDPRKYPINMWCKNTGITQNMIDIAKQKKVDNSPLDTHLDLMYPSASGCYAVKTGVIVERREGAGPISRKITYDDGVCVTAGCSYDRNGSCQ